MRSSVILRLVPSIRSTWLEASRAVAFALIFNPKPLIGRGLIYPVANSELLCLVVNILAYGLLDSGIIFRMDDAFELMKVVPADISFLREDASKGTGRGSA